jgi:hypothetical protein
MDLQAYSTSAEQFIPSIFGRINGELRKIRDYIFSQIPHPIEPEPEYSYILIGLKVFQNLQSTEVLALNGAFPEIGLVFRSAFESFILLKLFICFPEEMEKWNLESEIVEFRNQFILHKNYPNVEPLESLIAKYTMLSPQALKQLTGDSTESSQIIEVDLEKLEKKLQGYATKYCKDISSTNIRKLIEKITTVDPSFAIFSRLRLFLYDKQSQLAHSLRTAIMTDYIFQVQSFEAYKKAFQDYYRWYAVLSTATIVLLKKQPCMKSIDIDPYQKAVHEGGILLQALEIPA